MTRDALAVAPSHSNAMHDPISNSVRSSVASQDSDQFLSYYGSEDAGQTYIPTDKPTQLMPHRRESSTGSVSSSDYSLDSAPDQSPVDSEEKPKTDFQDHPGRVGARSEEGLDRRRLPFGQTDSDNALRSQHHARDVANESVPSHTLRSRRGLEDRVADLKMPSPADALVTPYPYLTPPSTAPVSGTVLTRSLENSCLVPTHSRSRSDALGPQPQEPTHQRKSSRDIGIVGAMRKGNQRKHDAHDILIFQQPSNHLQSPREYASDRVDPKSPYGNRTTGHQPNVLTDSRHQTDLRSIDATQRNPSPHPLVARGHPPSLDEPVQQTPSPSSVTARPPYDNHQPDLNVTPASLPKPLHIILPNLSTPPRPPRLQSPPPIRRRGDVEPVTHPLVVPAIGLPSLSCVGNDALKSSVQDTEEEDGKECDVTRMRGSINDPMSTPTSHHRREGAFSPSISLPLDPQSPQSASTPTPRQWKSDVDITISVPSPISASLPTASEPTSVDQPKEPKLEPKQNESWIRISPLPSREPTPSSETSGRLSKDIHRPSLTLSRDGHTPSPPPKSPKGFKASLVRRFSSLPRTPSSRGSSAGPKTPSPPMLPTRPLPPVQKIKSYWPPAMQCSDVLAKKTARERCMGYAQKINSLYIYDCGLGDWLMEAKYKGLPSHRPMTHPAFLSFNIPQLRQISGGSTISDMTFPRRPDASVATDLSVKSNDSSIPTSPPPLPYPSLAQSQVIAPARSSSVLGSSSSKRMLTSPATFFASLGRKASVRKDKFALSPLTSSFGKQLVNDINVSSTPNPRPVNITNAPTVPGGPRAPPNRAQRSKTVIIHPKAVQEATLTRRPSLFDLSPSERQSAMQVDLEFVRQVDKLADLLPNAERSILAGYLRRAGQDILAIGQYLEDEKNGTIRQE